MAREPEAIAHVTDVESGARANYVTVSVTAEFECECGKATKVYNTQPVICQECGQEWRMTV